VTASRRTGGRTPSPGLVWGVATTLACLALVAAPPLALAVVVLPAGVAVAAMAWRRADARLLLPAIVVIVFNFESLIARIGVPFVNPFNVAWLAASAALAVEGLRVRRWPLPRTPMDAPLVVNLAVTTISVVLAMRILPPAAFSDKVMVYQQWLQWLLFFWVTAALVRGERDGRMVVLAVGVMVAVAAVFGIRDYVSTRAVSGGAIERSQGLFGQANYAASFFAYYVPVIVAVAVRCGRRRVALVLGAAALVGVVACVLTFSRGGMAALGLGVAIVTVLSRSRMLVLGMAIGVVFVASDPTVQARFAETNAGSGDDVELDDSSAARLIAWRKAADLIGQRPLTGWGFFAFRYIDHPLDAEAAAQFGHGRMDVHNGHLNVLVSAGLPGAAALYLQFGAVVVTSLAIRRRTRSHLLRGLAEGMIASCACIMMVNLSGTRLYDRQVVAYFWILLGVLHGLARNERATAAETTGPVAVPTVFQ
jgi:O-antigen ligase